LPPPSLCLKILALTLSMRRLAQTNSVASIPRPNGMTSVAGPGVRTMTRPMSNTVNPTMATKTRLKRLMLRLTMSARRHSRVGSPVRIARIPSLGRSSRIS
jgi:hypothetical protein